MLLDGENRQGVAKAETDPEILTRMKQDKTGSGSGKKAPRRTEAMAHWWVVYLMYMKPWV